MHASLARSSSGATRRSSGIRALFSDSVSATKARTLAFSAVLAGLLVSGLHVITASTNVPLFIAGIALMTLPVTLMLVRSPLRSRADERSLLVLVVLSSMFVRCIYALTNPFLSGTDAPYHYFLTVQVEHGHWPKDQVLSNALPLLYLIFGTSSRATGVPVQVLVNWIPPLINSATIVLFYIFLRAYALPRIALIGAYVYAWEYTSFYFGYEFRTQSLAIALLAGFLVLRRVETGAPLSRRILAMLTSTAVLLMIALTAVVSSLLVALLLGAFALGSRVDRQRWGASTITVAPLTSVLVLVALLTYLVYASHAWNSAVPYLWSVLRSTLSLERAHDAPLKGVYVAGYGPFVTALQWIGRIGFIAGLVVQTRSLITGSRRVQSAPLLATWALLGLVCIATPLGSVLSPGRYFQFLSPFFGLYLGFISVYLIHLAGRGWQRDVTRFAVAVVLALWSLSGVLKLPAPLIGGNESLAAVPARIDWDLVVPVRETTQRYAAGRYLFCADATFAATSYALTGRSAFQTIRDRRGLRACISEAERSHPGYGVVVAFDRKVSGKLGTHLIARGFRRVLRVHGLRVLVRKSASAQRPASRVTPQKR